MHQIPIGVGNVEAQKSFIQKNEAFLREYPEICALLRKVFIRSQVISKAETQMTEVEGASLTEADTTALENRRMMDAVVFFLGRVAADDFGQLLILAGNGRGIGAYKILRGMYERIVTAAFIASNPKEAPIFLSHSFIEREKIWNRIKALIPGIQDKQPPEQIEEFEKACREVKEHMKQSVCKKCGQPIAQEAWTRRTLDSMAEKSDVGLAQSYAYCYLMPTFHSHATAFGLEARVRETEHGFTYSQESEDHARKAVLFGHGLILRLLKLQNDHFALGLENQIDACYDAFTKIWGKPGEGRQK